MLGGPDQHLPVRHHTERLQHRPSPAVAAAMAKERWVTAAQQLSPAALTLRMNHEPDI